MNFIETALSGAFVIEPKVLGDARGYFVETYRQTEFDKHIGAVNFVQDNESKSSYGVLRGLHFQQGEHAQAKLVRVVKGAVWDVAVDLRRNSPTFGQHMAIELNEENKRQLYVPRGFAHGFVVLKDDTVFTYKVDNHYAPESEGGIMYNDPALGIDWLIPEKDIKLSAKDARLPLFAESLF